MTARRAIAAATLIAFVIACGPSAVLSRDLVTPADVPRSGGGGTVLKAHTRSGELYLFTSWQVGAGRVSGSGMRYDLHRVAQADRVVGLAVDLDEVVLFEVNQVGGGPGTTIFAALAVGVLVFLSVGMVAVSDDFFGPGQ